VRALGGLKDALVIGVLLNAVWSVSRRPRRLDVIDKLVLAYLGIIVLYLMAPSVVHGLFGNQTFQVRLLAARTDGLFPLAFLAARHADIAAVWRERITKVLLSVAVLMGVCAIINVVSPTTWNGFLIKVVRLPAYQAGVLGVRTNPLDALDRGFIGSHPIVRAGSLLTNELTLGFYMLIALAICLQRLTAKRLTARYVLLTILCFVAITVTATRSAILAAVVVMLAAARIAARASAPRWLRLVILLVLACIAIAPVAASTTAGQRVLAFTQGQDPSAQAHANSTSGAVSALASNPLGRGLGTNPRIGQRFDVQGRVTSENVYLQVGNELGVATALVFIGLLIGTIRALWRRARSVHPAHALALATAAAGIGLTVGGFFLHIWLDFATALTFWTFAGLALANDPSAPEPTADRPPVLR
jgi:O-antigen ligase